MRVLVCGGRDYDNRSAVWEALVNIDHYREPITCVIHGGAKGADELGAMWARLHGVEEQAYEADWKQHGKAAGPIRNALMVEDGKPDIVLAFPGGRGTANMIKVATAANVEIMQVV